MAESLYAWRPQLVLGFHGCSEKIRDTFVTDRFSEIIESENDYDWLGPGMYFWENDYERALEWAEKKYPESPAVVGSYIKLGLCLDFKSSASLDLLKPPMSRSSPKTCLKTPMICCADPWIAP